jgi:hypothetical protein
MLLNYMWYSRFAELRCNFNLTPHVLVIVSTMLMFWTGTMEVCVFDVRCGRFICEQRYALHYSEIQTSGIPKGGGGLVGGFETPTPEQAQVCKE